MAIRKTTSKTDTAWRWLTIGQQPAGHEDELLLNHDVQATDYPSEDDLAMFGYTLVREDDA